MSEHTNETTIANQAETIRRLIEERDAWIRMANALFKAARRRQERIQELEQKGGA